MAVRRALLFTSIERYLNLTINFLVIAIVSRLLTPDEVGLSVIGLTILGIVELLRDIPSTYLVQQKDLRPEDVRTAFTSMALVSIVLVAGLIVLAEPLARTFNNPEVAFYIRLIAIACIPGPFERPIMALLRRDMEFGKLAIVNIGTYVAYAVVIVPLVALGVSYESFGWAYLAANTTAACIALCFRRELWMFRPLLTEWRRALAFGGFTSAWALLNKAYDLVPYLVLSRIFPAGAIGLFNRALTVSDLPNKLLFSGIGPVIFPAFAAESRAGRDLTEPYLLGVTYITVLLWPSFLLLILLAEPAVNILFGHQWAEIVPLVQIIAVSMLFSFTAKLNYPILVAAGAMRDLLSSAAIVVPIGLIVTCGATFAGLQALAWSVVFKVVFQGCVEQYYVQRHTRFTLSELFRATHKSALVTLFTMIGPLVVIILSRSNSDWNVGEDIGAFLSAAICWFAGLWLTRHPLYGEIHRFGDVGLGILKTHVRRQLRVVLPRLGMKL
jgi:O-antigen/teichoic acid export membrane protein